MIKITKWLLLAFLVSVPLRAGAQTVNAESCSATDVQNAINSASTGYIVNVPAGTCSWPAGSVTLNKAITLNGAGQGTTVGSDQTAAGAATQSCASSGTCIDVTGTPGSVTFAITMSSAGNIRIQDFAFTLTNNTNYIHPVAVTGTWPPPHAVIWSNDTFTVNSGTMMDSRVAGGVIFSHITFNGNWNDFFLTIKDDTDTNSWTTANTLGSADTTGLNNLYIEDSQFNGGSNGVFDCDDECRIVVRHDTFVESGGFNSHGEATSPYGMREFEIYSNTFTIPDKSCNQGNSSLSNINQYVWIRGASGVIYNNTFQSLYSPDCWGNKPTIRLNDRGAEDNRPQGSCSQVTYPIPHQLGQDNNGTHDFTDPIWFWGNLSSDGANPGPYFIQATSGWQWGNPCGFDWNTFFQWGRDAVNSSLVLPLVLSSNGGPVEGKGGVAKPGYAAYTYPHPLAGGASSSGGPVAPTNLIATVD